MRRKIAYIAATIFLLVLMSVTSCGGDDSVNLVFNQVQGNCAVANQSAATIRCDGGVFTFNGSVITPNPCYYLKANLDLMDESNAVIMITSVSELIEDGYCVECLGEISFDGTVELPGTCSKILSIVYNGATIAEYERQ
jgi:type 1 fimbria pilin